MLADRRARATATDVQPDREPGLTEGVPHRVPLRVAVVAFGREQRDVAAGQPRLRGREPDLLRRSFRGVDRDRGHAQQPPRRVGRVVRQPPVVSAHAVEPECGIGRHQRSAHVEDLRVDAVGVHVGDARGRIPCARPLVLELPHVERELLRRLPREVVERHDRRPLPLEHAEVALVGALDARRPVAELGVEVLLPRVVGHGDVRVRGDQAVLGHLLPPSWRGLLNLRRSSGRRHEAELDKAQDRRDTDRTG